MSSFIFSVICLTAMCLDMSSATENTHTVYSITSSHHTFTNPNEDCVCGNSEGWNGIVIKNGIAHCSATLINDRYVLATATCVKDSCTQMEVVLGVPLHTEISTRNSARFKLGRTMKSYTVQSVKLYPEYREWTGVCEKHITRGSYNNIALIKLDRPVHFTKYISPICLPTSDQTSEQFEGGIGLVNTFEFLNNTVSTQVLKTREVIIQKASGCGASDSPIRKFFHRNSLCVGFGVPGEDVNLGLEGGALRPLPMSSDNYTVLIGILSHQVTTESQTPVIFTDVSVFVGWISEHSSVGAFCDV